MMTSHRSQPRASISARLVGRNLAGAIPARSCLTLENKGLAVCTPAIRPDSSAYVDGNIPLCLIPLNQQGDAVARPCHLPLQVRHGGDVRAVDAEDHVASL